MNPRIRRIGTALLVLGACGLSPLVGVSLADVVQPVTVQLREQEPNAFLLQWQVPKTYPARAMPRPVLPADCRPQGERVLSDVDGNWLNRLSYRCEESLSGRSLGIDYPFFNPGQTTVIRLHLLSGDRRVHLLGPGEDNWHLPEFGAGFVEEFWQLASGAVLEGISHWVRNGLHWAFVLALCLLGTPRRVLRLVGSFSAAQLASVPLVALLGLRLDPLLAEGGLAIGVLLLALQALREGDRRSQTAGLAFLAGLAHGCGLLGTLPAPSAFRSRHWIYLVLLVLAMDALLLVLVWTLATVRGSAATRPSRAVANKFVAYLAGVSAVAVLLQLAILQSTSLAGPGGAENRLPYLGAESASDGGPGSRAVAPKSPDARIQGFLTVDPFEVRHEILLRAIDVAPEVGLPLAGHIEVEDQPEFKRLIGDWLVPCTTLEIDGAPVEPIVDRIDFLTVGPQGVLVRGDAIREPVGSAWVGVTVVYLTSATPAELTLSWDLFPATADAIPTTITDPASSRSAMLTAADPALRWTNRLTTDRATTVSAIAVEPKRLPVPIAGVPLLLIAAGALVRGARRGRLGEAFAVSRVLLCAGLLVAPIGQFAVPLPSALVSTPSPVQARRILAGVLPNVYRALEFRDESTAYDRLSISVVGDTLREVYLEHRRGLEIEERGGARARVEALEISEVRRIRGDADGGFDVDATWVIGGTVTHFGHRHFRQNRYDARIALVPVEGFWKIRSIELFDEERLR